MINKKFLLLQNAYMDYYTLNDLENLDNVVIVHRKSVFKNEFLNCLYNIHNSQKIRKFVNLPFKSFWYRLLFKRNLFGFNPDYIVFTVSWYSDSLIKYIRAKYENSILVLRFTDMVERELGGNVNAKIDKIRTQFDGVIVYNQKDADNYGFTYHSVGYSVVNKNKLKPCKSYDVVFIGAEKGRIHRIREAYNRFVSAGLSCFFYVIFVKEEDRRDDGIVYANEVMPFSDYLSYETSAKCLFEIVQEGSTGRTYRMMEAIMYNKLLVTNCKEILDTDYYTPQYVQLYDDVSDIDPFFVVNCPAKIDYNYMGDFSPIKDLEFIEKTWKC